MKTGHACRYCGSPARGNPCWYSIKYPRYAASGGDPPCLDYDYDIRKDRRRFGRRAAALIVVIVLALLGAWATF